ncbi:metal-dependent transcriptional regulator [Phototrophicus methaneseepsis]|uniref:Manganese transport regulator n=2 Tax=Phototrophicus methaneseepsis TaxID=2710758 RepID=A0A7S8E888_9CHLR|nr:metal-dependent transcriptional regulator [Phototrophicus methaneseepsis]
MAMQEYLAEAYRLQYYQPDDQYISTSALADVMHVSAPAVTRMVQRLKEADYLDHQPYRGIKLTEKGELEALAYIRTHRIVERFLVDVMGFGWHQVHDLADEIGPVVSERVTERMNEMAKYPRRCAHGEPIPHADGYMPRVVDYLLTDVKIGETYVVSRANTHDEDKLVYLDTLGIKPGVHMTLIERAPFNGPLHLEVNGKSCFIGHELSTVIRVCSQDEFELV